MVDESGKYRKPQEEDALLDLPPDRGRQGSVPRKVSDGEGPASLAWLRINRVLRVMLHTRWSAEPWSVVRIEFRRALALRSENPGGRAGSTNPCDRRADQHRAARRAYTPRAVEARRPCATPHRRSGRSSPQSEDNQQKDENAVEEAKIDNLHFHDCRHHFASWFVMRGDSLPALQKLLGHADLKMTLRYAHLAPHYLRDEIARTERPAHTAAKITQAIRHEPVAKRELLEASQKSLS